MVPIIYKNTNRIITILTIGNTILESGGHPEEGSTTHPKTKLPDNIRI